MLEMAVTKVVLLVVGSFNPPTIMHLRMMGKWGLVFKVGYCLNIFLDQLVK